MADKISRSFELLKLRPVVTMILLGSGKAFTNGGFCRSLCLWHQAIARNETGLREPMTMLLQVDWKAVFVPSISLVEIILRGSIVYLLIFVLLRLRRRQAGGLGIADLLVVVVIADAAQNAMASEYKSVTEGFVLVGTIVFWDYLLDYLSYRFPSFRRLITLSPLPLIKDGQLIWRNMRQELITKQELMEHLREEGIEDIRVVKKAYLEGDGHISIIKKQPDEDVEEKPKIRAK